MLPELADGGSEDSVQKLDLNKSSSLKKQDSREDVSEKLKNERVKHKILKNSWTRFFANYAPVPKNLKEGILQARTNQSDLYCRDESIRKKGFCAETTG